MEDALHSFVCLTRRLKLILIPFRVVNIPSYIPVIHSFIRSDRAMTMQGSVCLDQYGIVMQGSGRKCISDSAVLTFEHMHGDTGRFRIGRGARVVASVSYRGILYGQDAGLVPIGRHTDSVVRVIIHHACIMVPVK